MYPLITRIECYGGEVAASSRDEVQLVVATPM
jgi:hypothetical protein